MQIDFVEILKMLNFPIPPTQIQNIKNKKQVTQTSFNHSLKITKF